MEWLIVGVFVFGMLVGAIASRTLSYEPDHAPKGTLYGYQHPHLAPTRDYENDERKRLREQRRYELTKASMPIIVGMCSTPMSDDKIAEDSVHLADAILAELERGGAETSGR